MKLRIIQSDNLFIPQKKGWFFWSNFSDLSKKSYEFDGFETSECCEILVFKTLKEAYDFCAKVSLSV